MSRQANVKSLCLAFALTLDRRSGRRKAACAAEYDHSAIVRIESLITSDPVRRLLLAASLLLCVAASADTTKRLDIWGLGLLDNLTSAQALLARNYPHCAPVRWPYHESPTHPGEVIGGLAINPGLAHNDMGRLDLCPDSPGGEGLTDGVELRFAHPDVDPNQPLYFIEVKRVFPDIVYSDDKHVAAPFDSLRAQLIRKYGAPADQRQQAVASSSANLAHSLGIGPKVERHDYVVRYLWSKTGRLPAEEQENTICKCGGPYVEAEIEISRSPLTQPKNRTYVLSERLLLQDPDLAERQDAWNRRWLTGTAPPH
jgi:hypothetical protein